MSVNMKRFEFQLNISTQRYLNYYRGSVRHVVAQCTHGVTVQFPASLLTQFVTSTGIQGRFILTCDDDHKNSVLRRGSVD
jgi:hypothetical protein